MKTALDQDKAIFRLLNIPSITSALTGKVYRGKRPTSSLEDIVINTLTTGDGTRQFGVSTVHLYVPDVSIDATTFLANSARLETLTNLVKPILEETDGDDFTLWIDSTELVTEAEINQHFMRFRIEFRFNNFH